MLSVMRMIQEGHLEEDEDEKEDDDDEEEEGGQALGGGTHSLSKAELRKSNKPIMEKRRRARINTCLNELKSLILDAMRKDPSRHSKLEKADILEMTVKHLQAVQRQQLALAVAHDPTVLTKFRTGFTECAQEVTRYVSRIEGVEGGVRQRLLQHLGQCVTGLSTMSPVSFTAMAGLPLPVPPPPPPAPPAPPHMSSGDVNNNQARLLVAARLAAAGDAAGAALLLHGGLSLLSQGNPPPPQPRPSAPHSPPPLSKPPPPPPPPSDISLKVGTSLPGERPSRPSAFTAVRRSSSPSRFPLESCPRPPDTRPAPAPGPVPVPVPAPGRQVVAPAPRRLLGPETLVRAQVALRPLTLTRPRSPPRHPPAQTHTTHSTRTTPSNLSTGMHPHAVPTTTSHNPSFSDAAIPQSSLPHTLTTHQSTTPHTSLASNPTHLPRNPTTPTTSLTTHHLHSPSTTTTSSIASHPTHHLPHTSHKRPLENSQITRPNKVMKVDCSTSTSPPPTLPSLPPSITLRFSHLSNSKSSFVPPSPVASSCNLPPSSSSSSFSPLSSTTLSPSITIHLTPPDSSRGTSSSCSSPPPSIPSSHLTPPSSHITPPSSHLTPPSSHLTPPHPLHLTPPSHHISPPSTHLTPPSTHLTPPSLTSPHSPSKRDMKSEDESSSSPAPHSSTSEHEEKDMWRPW